MVKAGWNLSHSDAPKRLESRPRRGDKVVVHFHDGRSRPLPESAIQLHDQMDKIVAMLTATGWVTSRLLNPSPFMIVQKLLEGETYVTVSLLVSYMSDLRDGLNHTLEQTTRWRSRRGKQ